MMPREITIIGGGVAGLALGILLRRKGIPATIHEAQGYPRHRVCGEFISGAGLEVLDQMEMTATLMKEGAIRARRIQFNVGGKESSIQVLPEPALCISRFRLDQALAKEFRGIGGILKERSRWANGFTGEGIVCATGRRPNIEKSQNVVGLKFHAQNLELNADLEMHCSENAYVGLCRVEERTVNVCGLFRMQDARMQDGGSRIKLLINHAPNSLRRRLERAVVKEESFCAIAGLPLKAQVVEEKGECRVGDALGMIPPITGNGLSLSLESAHGASEPLNQYSGHEISWSDAVERVSRSNRQTFASRLQWGGLIQKWMFSERIGQTLLGLSKVVPGITNFLFRKTRD